MHATRKQSNQRVKGLTYLHPRALEARAVREVKCSLSVLKVVLPLTLVSTKDREFEPQERRVTISAAAAAVLSNCSMTRPDHAPQKYEGTKQKRTNYRRRLNRQNTFPQSMARQGTRSFSEPFSRLFFASLCRLPTYVYIHVYVTKQGHNIFSGPFLRSNSAPTSGLLYQQRLSAQILAPRKAGAPKLLRTVLKIDLRAILRVAQFPAHKYPYDARQ